jgi:hypothetical protein
VDVLAFSRLKPVLRRRANIEIPPVCGAWSGRHSDDKAGRGSLQIAVPLPRASTAPTGWWLHQGQIEEAGHPDEVLGNPKSERLQQFLSGNLK